MCEVMRTPQICLHMIPNATLELLDFSSSDIPRSDADILKRDLQRYRERLLASRNDAQVIRSTLLSDEIDNGVQSEDNNHTDVYGKTVLMNDGYSINVRNDSISSNATASVVANDAVREYMGSWSLEMFARKHSIDFDVAASGLNDEQLRHIVALYLVILMRKRIVRDRCRSDSKCCDDSSNNTDGNFFDEATRRSNEWTDELRDAFPQRYVVSSDTNTLADGLATYIRSFPGSSRDLNEDVVASVAVAVTSLYIYSSGNMGILEFLLRFFTAIKYPGQFLKSILLLLGESDSGKSLLISEVLRYVYSSMLSGTLSNSTLRNGGKDEINTDLMSMMQSHVCQCDEPEKLNPELFKNIISSAKQKCRSFFTQQPRYLVNMAKLILTSNDEIQMRSDAGVLTRLKYVIHMTHRFKPMHSATWNISFDFSDGYATPSVSHQFATRTFGLGVNFEKFRHGVFYLIEHYCCDMVNYNETEFSLPDMVSRGKISLLRNRRQALKRFASTYDYGERFDRKRYKCTESTIGGEQDTQCDSASDRNREDVSYDNSYDVRVVNNARNSSNIAKYKNELELFWIFARDYSGLLSNDIDRSYVSGTNSTDERDIDCDSISVDFDNDDTRADTREERNGRRSTGNRSYVSNATEKPPIYIQSLPKEMLRTARELYMSIDPFAAFEHKYRVTENSSVFVTDAQLTTALITFAKETGLCVNRHDAHLVASRIKQRLRTRYPKSYNEERKGFALYIQLA